VICRSLLVIKQCFFSKLLTIIKFVKNAFINQFIMSLFLVTKHLFPYIYLAHWYQKACICGCERKRVDVLLIFLASLSNEPCCSFVTGRYDANGDGVLDLSEFTNLVRLKSMADSVCEEVLASCTPNQSARLRAE
jgi:hypothetical protein